MSLIALMAVMTLVAVAMLAIAPTVQQGVQREKELETIRRGEEVADAIRQYVVFYQGKLPNSMDDLLEGLPQGTKKRQILRPSSAIDPLSRRRKMAIDRTDCQAFLKFRSPRAKLQQRFFAGQPASREPVFDRYVTSALVNIVNTETRSRLKEDSEEEIEIKTDKTSFIGVASQSRSRAIIAYYGIENHSKWIFTPLFRGVGVQCLCNPAQAQTEIVSRLWILATDDKITLIYNKKAFALIKRMPFLFLS